MCVQGRDMSQVRTREDARTTSTARYPHLLDSAIMAIVESGIDRANKNYTEKYNGLVEKALETAMKLPNLYKARENALVCFLEGEEKNKVAKEALISLAWVIAHHLTALCETEDSSEYLRKASQILDILFEGENEDDFIKAIRQRLQ